MVGAHRLPTSLKPLCGTELNTKEIKVCIQIFVDFFFAEIGVYKYLELIRWQGQFRDNS
jgi:hypothetical protein